MTAAADRRTVPVSVVMPVYGDLRFLDEAVTSILQQTWQEFEFIIVDDGTGQGGIFANLAARDPRIRVITNSTNRGVAASLNAGCRAARGAIIARMDADDVAEPGRIAALMKAFDDPLIGIAGSDFTTIGENGAALETISMPRSNLAIRWALHFYNPFSHPCVAFRADALRACGGYREDRATPEDYDLWSRMLAICRGSNLSEALLRYRLNSRGVTAQASARWGQGLDAVRRPLWNRCGVAYDREAANRIALFVSGFDITPPQARPADYRIVLQMLRMFLAAQSRTMLDLDRADADNLVQSSVTRILGDTTLSWPATLACAWDAAALNATVAANILWLRLRRGFAARLRS